LVFEGLSPFGLAIQMEGYLRHVDLSLLAGMAAVLAAALLSLAPVSLATAAPLAGALTLQPSGQCAETMEVAGGWDPYMGHVEAVEHQYYCGPTYAYPPEWYAAHLGAYPQYYTAYPVEPTTCGTYHFQYENGWYCYTGP